MLCQQCQASEATVHFSVVAWPSGDETYHLCESCYPKAEAERTASYNQKKPVPPAVEFERITVDCDIQVGDRIEIRVVGGASADPPARIDNQEVEEDES